MSPLVSSMQSRAETRKASITETTGDIRVHSQVSHRLTRAVVRQKAQNEAANPVQSVQTRTFTDSLLKLRMIGHKALARPSRDASIGTFGVQSAVVPPGRHHHAEKRIEDQAFHKGEHKSLTPS